ncbi:MAG: hypothetical protein QOH92_3545 [Chloroflexota bacterium]|jgi:hypothetical protein|nr:hypothetical protein [Chloroflexota bacterium]
MITDSQLESRLRHYGSVLRDDIQVSPAVHRQMVARLDRYQSTRRHRPIMQLAVAAAMLLVAAGAVVLVQRVRANELAKAEPRVSSVSPTDGADGVLLNGEFRITFAKRPATLPELIHAPADGRQAAPRWDGSTLVVSYSGLHTSQRYEAVLKSDYTTSLGGQGHYEKRWTFTTESGPPSAGAGPLIWYATVPAAGSHPSTGTQIALDWSGHVAGVLHESGSGIFQSPDGTRLLTQSGLIDQSGQPLGSLLPDKGGPNWADDSRHVCAFGTATGAVPSGNQEQGWLYFGAIGSPLHRVAPFGSFGGQSGPAVVACSFLSDRAVVEQLVIMGVSEVRVIKLSTGAVLFQRQYSNQQTPFVRASHDGQYLAEQIASVDTAGAQRNGATLIRRVSDGKLVARLDNQTVDAFSWDGARVVTMPADLAFPDEARLVDWQSGTVLWRLPGPPGTNGGERAYALPRPNGTDMVVGIGSQSADGVGQLWLVRADGTATQIAKGPLSPGF